MILTPKNWKDFQHYKDRAPAWIKLHRSILDNFEFFCLPIASRALAPCLWLLASEYEDGKISASLDELAFRLRMTRGELADALSPLIEKGFFDASEPLAERKQDAIPEKEREIEEEIDTVAKATGASAPRIASPASLAVTESDIYRLGRDVLGKNCGGVITSLRKHCRQDLREVRDLIEQAREKAYPMEWVQGVLRGTETAKVPLHQIFPEDVYRNVL
ncbi:hypothetical protein IVB27_32360 [Bradyrhizobium sp. 197]|uniref:hypothetical protein n=1 Tax=Bradyrhizobium sp. 197 TaxID=2782663 RepID=UPI001FF94E8D|nr:hypothetical protein [Bradyrhizobium sp. 197]MCK1479308.1 hypothetical protein [Bradyrhizobium sp. 197]